VPRITERQESILVVEDDPVACDLVRETLVSEGYAVSTANNGCEALQQIDARCFELVITDLAMPELDGMALLLEIKRYAPRPRIIVMTASREEHLVKEALRRGADLVVLKPVRQAEIIRMVHTVLEDDGRQPFG
jgi:CheY-like chemotaxis protein